MSITLQGKLSLALVVVSIHVINQNELEVHHVWA